MVEVPKTTNVGGIRSVKTNVINAFQKVVKSWWLCSVVGGCVV